MQSYLPTLLLTTVVVIGFIILFNFCRRRLRKTPHGLTASCHKEGGHLCASCAEKMRPKKRC